MDNRLIDLIMNLRICYDKSIEIQLFKELLKNEGRKNGKSFRS